MIRSANRSVTSNVTLDAGATLDALKPAWIKATSNTSNTSNHFKFIERFINPGVFIARALATKGKKEDLLSLAKKHPDVLDALDVTAETSYSCGFPNVQCKLIHVQSPNTLDVNANLTSFSRSPSRACATCNGMRRFVAWTPFPTGTSRTTGTIGRRGCKSGCNVQKTTTAKPLKPLSEAAFSDFLPRKSGSSQNRFPCFSPRFIN